MTFAHPWLIAVAIAGTVAFFAAYRFVEDRRSQHHLRYSNLPFLVAAVQAPRWPSRVLNATLIAAVALTLLSLSGPHVNAAVPVRDGAVVLCIDTSGSMNATDVDPTRAQAALSAMRAFIDATPDGTAVGIVSFAGDAQAIVQPTRDRDQVRAALDQVPAPNGATAIGDALALAQRILPHSRRRVVVLITDGENNSGVDPMQAAQALGSAHITLYTVGIGTNSGALIPGTLEAAGINEDALRSYAAATGGAYSRAGDATQLHQALAQLGRSTLFERKNVDVSLASALAGALVLVCALFAGMAVGRFP